MDGQTEEEESTLFMLNCLIFSNPITVCRGPSLESVNPLCLK